MMEIKQSRKVFYNLTMDEEAYNTIKLALRYRVESTESADVGFKHRGNCEELLHMFPSKCAGDEQ